MPKLTFYLSIIFASLLIISSVASRTHAQPMLEHGRSVQLVKEFLTLSQGNTHQQRQALVTIRREWQPNFVPMVLEVIHLSRDPAFAAELFWLLKEKTQQKFGFDINRWYEWAWAQAFDHDPHYATFKSLLYRQIDPTFENYFHAQHPSTIRLDEVRWGGVRQDGIPPLRNPRMLTAQAADYLDDSDIVFGLEINGDARAYPQRILGWHEMFVDTVGGVPVAGVYCTLCGTMILYKTEHDGVNHKLGTSGFLYRSNKLMYDKKTQSLWNTFWGRPVIGPLVEKDIELERLSVVTTTWGEWRRRHPQSQVLSLKTGHDRNYDEGAAYREYYATDELMFTVPERDRRLKNKDEVLGLIFSQHPGKPLALSAQFLTEHTIYHDQIGDISFVILTDQSGANRVYQTNGLTFKQWDQNKTVVDTQGTRWTLSEAKLQSTDGRSLYRLPAQRAFWFGWYSSYSHTRLVQ